MPHAAQFDLVVIGAGPGGYVAAIRAAQLGMKVACVEKDAAPGGTCLNVGCIPSKALLESSELYHQARNGLSQHGVSVGEVKLDLAAMMARKDKVVGELTRGVEGLFKKNKIERFVGTGRIASINTVEVRTPKGETQAVNTRQILIATGSEPIPLPNAPFDGERILSSTGALALAKVPEHLIVIGGGVIGLELGSVWLRLGAKVTVIELLPHLLGSLDGEISKLAQRIFAKQGMTFHLGTRVTGVEKGKRGVTLAAQDADGKALELKGDAVLVAIGRRPYSEGLGARELGIAFDDKGRIQVDAHYRTSVANVYAIGDVIAGPMLAHKASEEGIAAVEAMAGLAGHVNPDAIPWIVYTWPEIAWVGAGEEELKQQGREYRMGKYPFQANPRAKTMGETEGLVKILADKRTDRLLGVLVIGPRASDVIAEAAVAMEFSASAEDLARSVHAHPTLSEAVKEAALGVAGRSIHL
jgi:dihydrolipoamide dehydrogenase